MKYLKLQILLFSLIFTKVNAQSWEQMEGEYNALLQTKKHDLAISKAKEMYAWVKKNEGDTKRILDALEKEFGGDCCYYGEN